MRAAISTTDLDPRSLVERVRRTSGMAGADLARTVSVTEPYEAASLVGRARTEAGPVFRILANREKYSMLRPTITVPALAINAPPTWRIASLSASSPD